MFERLKYMMLLLLIGIISLPINEVCAQRIKSVEAMKASDFARKYGGDKGKTIADTLEGKNATKIVCGDSRNMCDRNTQVCLKCKVKRSSGYATGYHNDDEEYGKCVSKDDLDPNNNLRSYWPPDLQCPESVRDSPYVTISSSISIEERGFIAKNIDQEFFFTSESIAEEPFKGADGKLYELVIRDTEYSIAYAGSKDGGGFKGCDVLPVKLYNMQGCLFCPLAAVVFSAANDMVAFAFSRFKDSFAILLATVFCIWLALQVLNQVVSTTKQDAPKFIATILKQGFKVAFAFFLLLNANDLFTYFINPLLDGGIQLGQTIQNQILPMEPPSNYTPSSVSTDEIYFNHRPTSVDDKITAQTLYEKIDVYLASIQYRLAYLQAVGTTMFCVGSHSITFKKLVKEVFGADDNPLAKGIRMMFFGGVFVVFAFLLTIAFGFYFIDAILQLAIIGAMLPFMIAGWPFKITAQYASTGFKMLLNTFFVMFFISFVITVNITLVDESLTMSQTIEQQKEEAQTEDGDKFSVSKETSKGLNAITEAMNAQNFSALERATDIGFTGFMLMAFGFLFGFKFVAKASELANTLSSGGFKGGISSKIGTMGASAVKGFASKLTQPVRKVAADKFHEAGGVEGMAAGLVGGVAGALGKGAAKAGMSGVAKGLGGVAKGAATVKGFSQKVHSAFRDPKLK